MIIRGISVNVDMGHIKNTCIYRLSDGRVVFCNISKRFYKQVQWAEQALPNGQPKEEKNKYNGRCLGNRRKKKKNMSLFFNNIFTIFTFKKNCRFFSFFLNFVKTGVYWCIWHSFQYFKGVVSLR